MSQHSSRSNAISIRIWGHKIFGLSQAPPLGVGGRDGKSYHHLVRSPCIISLLYVIPRMRRPTYGAVVWYGAPYKLRRNIYMASFLDGLLCQIWSFGVKWYGHLLEVTRKLGPMRPQPLEFGLSNG